MRKVFLLFFIMLGSASCNGDSNKSFFYGSNLFCEISTSTDKQEKVKNLTLTNLDSETVTMVLDNGYSYPLKKTFENSETLTIQLTATVTGSTDLVVLNKKSGNFTRTQAGSFLGDRSVSQNGRCK